MLLSYELKSLKRKEEDKLLTWSEDSTSPPSNLQHTSFLRLEAPSSLEPRTLELELEPPKCVVSKGAHTKAKQQWQDGSWVLQYFALGASLGKYLTTLKLWGSFGLFKPEDPLL